MTDGDVEESPSSAGSSEGVALDAIPLHSTNLLTVLDENGVIRYESPAIEDVFGFTRTELVNEPVADYVHPDDREQVLEAFRNVVSGENGTVEAVEYRHEQADGTYCWVESVSSANPTPAGHYVINTRDISEQRAREQRLRDTNDRLDEFARALSHDLRNPLQVARGRLALATEESTSEHLAAVDRAHDRMETLVEDLLALEHNRATDGETEPVDLRTVVDESWQNVETGSATLDSPRTQVILADRSRLQQLLENLVRNAIEHGDSATVTVDLLEDGFYVEDDGPGIPEDVRDDVFADGYSTTQQGTGFGLSIVSQIAGAHGWNVQLTDGTDGGARFEITGVEFTNR